MLCYDNVQIMSTSIFTLRKRIYFLICFCIVYEFICPIMCRHLWRTEEGIRYLGTGVTGTCEPAAVGAGN